MTHLSFLRLTTIGIAALFFASACGEARDPVQVQSPPEVAPHAEDPLLDQLAEAPTPEEEAAALAMPTPLQEQAAERHGCALQAAAPTRVLTAGSPPAILASGDSFLVAAYDQNGVAIVRARPGRPAEPFATIPLEANAPLGAAPAIAHTDELETTLVALDGRGRVLSASFDPTLLAAAPIAREIAPHGADRRFPPAIRAIGPRRVIAWTDGSRTPMRLLLAIADRAHVLAQHDVTPIAGGGAAPVFIEGEREPILMFVDPRAGISVVHRVRLGVDGSPGPIEVARPLNLAAEPPAFSIARATASAHTWIAYAAIGNLATRAVGLVHANGTDEPSALVPGLGYGEPLTIDAVAFTRHIVFAAEAPSAATRDAPHEIRLRVVDDSGAGDPLVLGGPATDPSLARRDDGLIGIAYRVDQGVWVHFARCAESR